MNLYSQGVFLRDEGMKVSYNYVDLNVLAL